MSPFINVSNYLVSMHDNLVTQPHTTYREIFWPYSCWQQQEMFHTSAVGFCLLICRLDGYFLSGISPKRSGQWFWFWKRVVKVSFEINFFARVLFNFFAPVLFNSFAPLLFNFFARDFLNTCVCLVLVLQLLGTSCLCYNNNSITKFWDHALNFYIHT